MDGMTLGGFEIPLLVVGIVQVIKKLFPQLSDQGTIIVAFVVGVVFLGLAQALPYIGETASAVILAVVRVLGYATAIPGWFSVVKNDVLGR